MTDNPIAILSSALAAALYRDLPDIEYLNRDWDAIKTRTEPMVASKTKRRPIEDEVKVHMFPQSWGSTALGYGGMGGAKTTTTHTVIIEHRGWCCVYFGSSRLAYALNQYDLSARGVENFQNDIRNCTMASVNEYEARYKI
jgi:hypothetical protein